MKIILYLGPRPGTNTYNDLIRYWSQVQALMASGSITFNEAMKYPPHITLTAFFDTNDLPSIIAAIQSNFITKPRAYIKDWFRRNYVGMDMTSPEAIEMTERFREMFPSLIAPKTDLHIAMFQGNVLKDNTLVGQKWDEYDAFVQPLIAQMNPDTWQPTDFDVVLYRTQNSVMTELFRL